MGEVKKPRAAHQTSGSINDSWHRDMLLYHAARLERLADIGFDKIKVLMVRGSGSSQSHFVLSCDHQDDPYCIEVAKRATKRYNDFITDLDDALTVLESYVLTLDEQCREIRDKSHLERNDYVQPASDGNMPTAFDEEIPHIPVGLLVNKYDD